MNTEQLLEILNKDLFTSQFPRGVSSRDEFIERFTAMQTFPTSIHIFNTHYSYQPGEHWILLIKHNNEINYFDSFGRSPHFFPDIYQLVRKYEDKKCLHWNEKRVQTVFSTVCGDYCLLYALLWARGWERNNIMKIFLIERNGESRDHAVRRFLLQIYNYSLDKAGTEGIDNVHIEGTRKFLQLL